MTSPVGSANSGVTTRWSVSWGGGCSPSLGGGGGGVYGIDNLCMCPLDGAGSGIECAGGLVQDECEHFAVAPVVPNESLR